MISLLLSILFSTGIYLIFGWLKKYKLQPLPTILVNYFTAATWGFLLAAGGMQPSDLPKQAWFWTCVAMGVLFVSTFNLVGKTAQTHGVTVATVASKMSMVIPIAFSILFIGEQITLLKFAGIILAFVAVYYTALREDGSRPSSKDLLRPLLVFISCGFVDLSLKYAEHSYFIHPTFEYVSPSIFLFAGITGLAYLILFERKIIYQLQWQSVAFGLALGSINYFSLVYIFKAMADPQLSSTVLFPVNNLGIVVLSAIAGVVLFNEQLSFKNKLGLVAAVIAVLIMAL